MCGFSTGQLKTHSSCSFVYDTWESYQSAFVTEVYLNSSVVSPRLMNCSFKVIVNVTDSFSLLVDGLTSIVFACVRVAGKYSTVAPNVNECRIFSSSLSTPWSHFLPHAVTG